MKTTLDYVCHRDRRKYWDAGREAPLGSIWEGCGNLQCLDVLRAMRLEAPLIDIYMLSNFAEPAYRQLAERLGARGFFDKTTEIGRVVDLITARAAAPH